VFEALSINSQEALEDTLCKFSLDLYKIVLIQFLEYSVLKSVPQPLWQFRLEMNENGSSTESSITLEWRRRTSNGAEENEDLNGVILWVETTQAIEKLVSFIKDNILLKQPHLCQIMGNFLFRGSASSSYYLPELKKHVLKDDIWKGPLISHLLNMFYHICIPDKHFKLKEISSELQQASSKFEKFLKEVGFIQEIDDSKMPFSKYFQQIDQMFAQKRITNILTRGRDILLKEDYHTIIEVGTLKQQRTSNTKLTTSKGISIYPDDIDPDSIGKAPFVFDFEKCSISNVSNMLMKLCHETLNEAVSSQCPPSTAPMLYRTSRDLLDLYRALIPAVHGSSISTIPRTAAVCHNDCVYFAHNCLTLAFEYKQKFKASNCTKSFLNVCTFVDFVPLFREMGDRTLVDMIEHQKSQLLQLIQERVFALKDALRANEAVMEWTEAEHAIRAAHYHLQKLSQAWKSILSQQVFGSSIGILIDTLLSLVLDQILHATDISEPATHFVSSLFSHVERCSEFFHHPQPQQAKKFCSQWERFYAVGKFVDMSLLDINLALSEGFFRSITSQELSKLITAVFDDSEKRRNIIRALSAEKAY